MWLWGIASGGLIYKIRIPISYGAERAAGDNVFGKCFRNTLCIIVLRIGIDRLWQEPQKAFLIEYYYILTEALCHTGDFPQLTNGSLMRTEETERGCDLSEATRHRQDSSRGFRTPAGLGSGILSTKHIAEAS